jgi:hypothetical protein
LSRQFRHIPHLDPKWLLIHWVWMSHSLNTYLLTYLLTYLPIYLPIIIIPHLPDQQVTLVLTPNITQVTWFWCLIGLKSRVLFYTLNKPLHFKIL